MARGRANKKRRTEIVSSDESDSSSSSESEVETQTTEKAVGGDADVSMEDERVQDNTNTKDDGSDITIDGLLLPKFNGDGADTNKANDKTEEDVLATRLRLRSIDDKFKELNNKHVGPHTDGASATNISSDEWLGMMVQQYGEDLETLRTTAADFKNESVALVADLLRSTQDIFKEV